jgi:hypothetical protein
MKSDKELTYCQSQIEKMLARSQTKVIFPLITFGLVKAFYLESKDVFSDSEIRKVYENAVREMTRFLGHDMHIGGKYYDAYPSRNLPRYQVVKALDNKRFRLLKPYTVEAANLVTWIPARIEKHINEKLTIIPKLSDRQFRIKISEDRSKFSEFVRGNIDKNPATFEIFSFAIVKDLS